MMEARMMFCALLTMLVGSVREDNLLNVELVGTHRTRVAALPRDAGLKFPSVLASTWTGINDVGLGSYGAVWIATAKKHSCSKCQEGKQYAIKLFFAVKRKQLLTWRTATSDEQAELQAAQKECQIATELSGYQDERAKFIAGCVEEHVSRYAACGNARTYCDSPLYVVLEPSGEELGRWWLKHGISTSSDGLRRLLRQGLEALSFVASHNYVHHDIKSDNLLVRVGPDGQPLLQLIDWGASIKTKSRCQPTVSNANAPPEWDLDCGYDTAKPAAYDLFCMGNVFVELIAGTPLFQMYNHSRVAPQAGWEMAARTYCRKAGLGHDKEMCNFWYSLQQFWHHIQISRMDGASIKQIANEWANAPLPADVSPEKKQKQKMIKAHFFDKLTGPTEISFLDFLDLLAQVFRSGAKDRPTAQQLLDHDWLQDASVSVSIHNLQLAEDTSPVHDTRLEFRAIPDVMLNPSSKFSAKASVSSTCLFRGQLFSREAMCSRLSHFGDSCADVVFGSLFTLGGACKTFCQQVQSTCTEEQVNPPIQYVRQNHEALEKPSVKPKRQDVLTRTQEELQDKLSLLNCLFNGEPFAKETMCRKLENTQDRDCLKVNFQIKFNNLADCTSMCNLVKPFCHG